MRCVTTLWRVARILFYCIKILYFITKYLNSNSVEMQSIKKEGPMIGMLVGYACYDNFIYICIGALYDGAPSYSGRCWGVVREVVVKRRGATVYARIIFVRLRLEFV